MDKSRVSDRNVAAQLFNQTWTYLENPELAPADIDRMIHCSHASIHHWLETPKRTAANLAIGYWQLARVYEKAGIAPECERYAKRSLSTAEELGDPALLLSAHEVMARAEVLRGDRRARDRHESRARELLEKITDEEDRAVYLADIDGIPQ